MAHIQDQYSGLWKPQDLAVDKIVSQKMFVDNTNTLSAFILLQKTMLNQSLNSLTALRAVNTTNTTLFCDRKLVYVKINGWFRFDRACTLADNGITVIAPTIGGGRWISINNYYYLDTASTDAYTILMEGITDYNQLIGVPVEIKVNTANTDNATLNINSLGSKNICRSVNTALITGDIIAGQIINVVYDGTQFQLRSQGANTSYASKTETLTNKTLTLPKFATGGAIADANGNELIKFPASIASAVNEITISNATTTNSPSISASGADAIIDLMLSAKGNGGVVKLFTNGVLTSSFDAQSSAVNYLKFNATATGTAPTISALGSDANISLNLVSKGTGTVKANGADVVTTIAAQTLSYKTLSSPKITTCITDSNGNELVKFPSIITNAVNEVSIENAVTGGTPVVGVTGDDANISMVLKSKGTGTIQAFVNNVRSLIIDAVSGAVNYLKITSSSSGNSIKMTAEGTDTNISVSVQGKGTGGVYLSNHKSNYLMVDGADAGLEPNIKAYGADTDVDVNIIPKGAGNLTVKGKPIALRDAPVVLVTASKTLGASDLGTKQVCSSANPIVITVPTGMTVDGDIVFIRDGVGTLNIIPDTGVTQTSVDDKRFVKSKQSATLSFIATNSCYLIGALE